MKKALFFEYNKKNERVLCRLCPHRCKLKNNTIGACGVRFAKDGILYSLNYRKAIALHLDPIEKKPLFHFYPSKPILSISTVGCNLFCKFCQNHTISMFDGFRKILNLPGNEVDEEELVRIALLNNSIGIAYTYTEPTVFYEYVYDVSKKMKEAGLKNVWVTNGFIEEEPQLMLEGLVDGVNNDLKSFSDKTYRKYTGGRLKPILEGIKRWKKIGAWLEITTLLIPEVNDSKEEIKDIAQFIKIELGAETPWHISRFHPHYKMLNTPPTSVSELKEAREIGLSEGLKFVYTGNVPGDEGETTFCPECKRPLIKRYGYHIEENNIIDGKCKFCGEKIEGVWE